MNNTVKDSAIKKLKLLITVVDRPKGEFYLDVLGQYNVNFQMVTNGQGTANSQLLELLGLEPHKAVILSVVREDLVGGDHELPGRQISLGPGRQGHLLCRTPIQRDRGQSVSVFKRQPHGQGGIR